MTSPYADLDRPPLPRTVAGTGWRSVRVVAETASTNAEVAAAARAGEPDGLVLVAEHQSAGRGRLDRVWTSPPRAGLTMSFLLRPPAPGTAGPLLPLLVAAAAATALSRQTGLDVRLKWPNDLMTADRKLGGLLAEAAGGAVVVGLGLNVSNRRDELPRADATSLALEVPDQVDRLPVLRALLRGVSEAYRDWLAGGGGGGGAILAAYRPLCSTVGRPVRALLPGGRTLEGTAEGVDDGGRLLLRGADGRQERLSAGDVIHLLPG